MLFCRIENCPAYLRPFVASEISKTTNTQSHSENQRGVACPPQCTSHASSGTQKNTMRPHSPVQKGTFETAGHHSLKDNRAYVSSQEFVKRLFTPRYYLVIPMTLQRAEFRRAYKCEVLIRQDRIQGCVWDRDRLSKARRTLCRPPREPLKQLQRPQNADAPVIRKLRKTTRVPEGRTGRTVEWLLSILTSSHPLTTHNSCTAQPQKYCIRVAVQTPAPSSTNKA
jgi:hypothetical protein